MNTDDILRLKTTATRLRRVVSAILCIKGKIQNVVYVVVLLTIYQAIMMVCVLLLHLSLVYVYITYLILLSILVVVIILFFIRCKEYYHIRIKGDALVDQIRGIETDNTFGEENNVLLKNRIIESLVVEYQSMINDLMIYIHRVKVLCVVLLIISMSLSVLPFWFCNFNF